MLHSSQHVTATRFDWRSHLRLGQTFTHAKCCLIEHLQVFTQEDWLLMGFPVIERTLKNDDMHSKLKIREHPPTSQLVSLLERQPPQDEETARKWFSVLAGRIARTSQPNLCLLCH